MFSLLLTVACLGQASATWTVNRPLGEIATCLQQHAMSSAAHLPPGLLTENGADTLGENLDSIQIKWFPAGHYIWWRADFHADVKVLLWTYHVTGHTVGDARGEGHQTTFRLRTTLECDQFGFIPRGINKRGPSRVLDWERDQLRQLTEAKP